MSRKRPQPPVKPFKIASVFKQLFKSHCNTQVDILFHDAGCNDKEIQDFVMGYDMAHIFLDKLEDMIRFLVPNYVLEGKNQLVVAIGCTGGKHRSVTLANKLYERLQKQADYGVRLEHRDIGKDAARGK